MHRHFGLTPINWVSLHNTLTTLRTPPRGFVVYGLSLWSGELSPDKDFYRSLCPLRWFWNSTNLNHCCIASHRGDFYFCTSSAGVLGWAKRRCRWHIFWLSLLPWVITRCLISIWFAVGRTAEVVTYRSYFCRADQEALGIFSTLSHHNKRYAPMPTRITSTISAC